jgi:hypothetical protein
MWRLTRICERSSGTTPARPWTCQVMAVGEERDALLIDLVPLEPGSIGAGPSTMFPFTLRISRDLGTASVAAWAASADVVGVHVGRLGPTDRLMLSAGGLQLVFELPVDWPCHR